MPDPDVISTGRLLLAIECPECDRAVQFSAELFGSLTNDGEHRRLRPKLVAKPVEHSCADPGQPDLFDGEQ